MPAGARELDLSRYTVFPGFVDAHIHLWTGPRTPGLMPSYGTVLDEMITMVKFGATPQQALKAATLNGATVLVSRLWGRSL